MLSNNSRWMNFVIVRNEHWCHGHVVLLGDALHTAHFSIGSGTKLALEDSIALSQCLGAHTDIAVALGEFERLRKPIVDAYQAAAGESLLWFETFRDDMRLDPICLAYRVMTRSGRVTYESLKKRDPRFVAAYDRLIGSSGLPT